MDGRAQLREFLSSRRARVNPTDVGLPAGGNRRVPGLRREELATLAGVSVSYYTRLERGDAKGVSESVLEAIGRVLLLDEAERIHLDELVRALGEPLRPRSPRGTSVTRVRPAVQTVLDALIDVPAIVHNARMDVLAASTLGRALYSPMFDRQPHPNLARYVLLDSAEPGSPRWETGAEQMVSILRAAAGHDPYDKNLSDLVGELSTRSDTFRRLWARHNVRKHANGRAQLQHPEVGDLTLAYESFEVSAEPGLALKIYNAEPGSVDADKLRLLATWYATRQDTQKEEGIRR